MSESNARWTLLPSLLACAALAGGCAGMQSEQAPTVLQLAKDCFDRKAELEDQPAGDCSSFAPDRMTISRDGDKVIADIALQLNCAADFAPDSAKLRESRVGVTLSMNTKADGVAGCRCWRSLRLTIYREYLPLPDCKGFVRDRPRRIKDGRHVFFVIDDSVEIHGVVPPGGKSGDDDDG